MAFCQKCGAQLADGAAFCASCGTPVGSTGTENQRRQVYEGEIRKCPSCGQPLESFQAVCPSCGHELRNVKTATSVQKLADQIAEAEKKRMQKSEGKASIWNQLQRGTQLDNIDISIANMVNTFPIPNAKEDIVEFLFMASNNITSLSITSADDAYSFRSKETRRNAWNSKIEEAYEKAKLSFPSDPLFAKVQEIYDKTHNKAQKEAKKETARSRRSAIIGVICVLVGFGGFGILGFWGYHAFNQAEKSFINKLETETQRLELIHNDVLKLMEEGDYVTAKLKAQQIQWTVDSSLSDNTRKLAADNKALWEQNRADLLAEIERRQK